MSVSRSMQLVNKSVDSMVSAIELYNKPDFRYREEIFCIIAVNSWELLLKAKILKDSKNNISSISVRKMLKNKDGSKSRKWRYKENRTGNRMTLDIFSAMGKLEGKGMLDRVCRENIEAMIEVRDNAIHFHNVDPLLSHKVQELGMATIVSYVELVYEWFSIKLDKYNFFLMPMSFFHPSQVEPILIRGHDTSVANMLSYIASKEREYPPTPGNKHNITIAIETKFTKSKKIDAQEVRVSSNPDVPSVQISLDDIKKTHPLDYKELTNKLRSRYDNFKVNREYHELRKNLEKSQEFCFHYPLNPMNPEGSTKSLFSVKVFEEFDKNYHRKNNEA